MSDRTRVVDLHIPVVSDMPLEARLAANARPELLVALAETGMQAAVSQGTMAYRADGLVAVHWPALVRDAHGNFTAQVTEGVISVQGIDVMHNTARAIIGQGLPVQCNEPPVRWLGRDKNQQNELFARCGLRKQWASPRSLDASDIAAALDRIAADQVVLKPVNGRLGKDVYIGTKAEIAALCAAGSLRAVHPWILEEKLDETYPLPLRGANEVEQVKLLEINQTRVPREARVFTFGRNPEGGLIAVVIVRAAPTGDVALGRDSWILVEQASIPTELLELTSAVEQEVRRTTGVSEFHAAFDWAFAGERGWLPMEINTAKPDVNGNRYDPDVTMHLARLLARQLYRVAIRR